MNRQVRFLLLSLSVLLWPTLRHLSPTPAVKAAPAMAGFTVNTTDDTPDADLNDNVCADANGRCSLRAAISQANALAGDDTITLPAGTYTQTLVASTDEDVNAGGDWDINSNLTLIGADSGRTILQAATTPDTATERVLHVVSGTVELRDLSVRYGKTEVHGGGIFNQGVLLAQRIIVSQNIVEGGFGGGIKSIGPLTLTDCTVTGNLARYIASQGGGIFLSDSGTFTNCTINGNTAGSAGGGIAFVGASGGTLRLINCTISNNRADNHGAGGGLLNLGNNGTTTLEVINCTLVGNTSAITNGGGILTFGGASTTRLRNTLLVDNTAPSLFNINGTVLSLGHNLASDDGGGFLNQPTDILNANALLSPVADNGGPTPTHALLPGSPALDAGDNCVLTKSCASNNLGFNLMTDQRGKARTRDGNNDGTAQVDIGAYELAPLVVDNTSDDGALAACTTAPNDCSLRGALVTANAQAGADVIFFAPSVLGTINLTGALPDITDSLTINGPGAKLLTVRRDTGGDYRIFNIPSSGLNIAISGLTIRDGKAASADITDITGRFGGGIYSTSPLTLTDCVVTRNEARTVGGGVFLVGASSVFTGCSFSGNTANHQGGGIVFQGDAGHTLQLVNCTISGNTANGFSLGSGILNISFSGSSMLELTNCTIADNTSTDTTRGGGLATFSFGSGNVATSHLRNTLVAGNSRDFATLDQNGGGPSVLTSLGNNLDGDGSSGFTNGMKGDLVGTNATPLNALLAPLGDYGGPTPTHALLPASPALDAGDNCVLTKSCASNNLGFNLTTDQRGLNRQVGSAVDIGAFESRGFTLALASGNNQSTPVTQAFANPLTATVSSAFSEPVVGGVVTFTAPGSGPSALFSGNPATIAANGQASVNATANSTRGSYQVAAASPGANAINFNLTNTCAPLVVVPPALSSALSGQPFNQSFTQSGGVAPVSFTLVGGTLPPGLNFSANGTLSGTPTQAGSFALSVQATGANDCQSAPTNYTLTLSCPTITLSPVNPNLPAATAGVAYAQSFTQSGAFANSASFSVSGGSLPNGLTLNPNGNLTGTPTQTGTFSFTVKATDTLGCMGSQSYTLVVNCPTVAIVQSNLLSIPFGAPYSQTLTGTGGIAPYTFSLANGSNLPAGLTLAPNGTLSGTPTATGTTSFTINVKDANQCAGQRTYSLTVQCPTLTTNPPSLPNAVAGAAYSQTLTAAGGVGPYTLTLANGSNLPPGLTLLNGGLSGMPTTLGVYTFTVNLTDNGLSFNTTPCSGSRTYTLSVVCPTITLNPTALANAVAGTPYTQTVTASPAGTTYNYLVTTNSLPPGLTLNPATGVISGTPLAAGNFTFVITATGWVNGQASCSGTRSYNLLVTANCPTLTLSPGSLAASAVGAAYSQTFTATGGTAPYNFAITAGTLPPGLTLASNGALSGTPTTAGTYSFTVTATAGGGCTGSQTYTLTLTCPTITLIPASLPSATAGIAYSQTVTASPAGNYLYTLATGNLPPGLSLNATTGALTGTATATGSYAFSIKAERGVGCGAVKAYTIVVNCPTVTLAPTSLPGGNVGTAYNQTLSATPAGNYSFTVSSGALPSGLTLSTAGTLSGTPTASGTFTFSVKATGWGTCNGTRSYTLTISAPCAPVTLTSLPNGAVNAAYYGDLSGTLPSGSYTFSLDGGTLPTGLTLDNLFGALVGTPTASGTFSFTLKATSANGCSGTRSYSVVIGSGAAARAELADYDGDGQADPALWAAATGSWNLLTSAQSRQSVQSWGAAGDVPLLGDYDGDGKTDLAVFRPSNATWYVQRSSDGQAFVKAWGLSTDVPVPGDYDGDGQTDLAVWRGSTGGWFIHRSSDGQTVTQAWGSSAVAYQDVPLAGDYDGDRKTDLAVFRQTSGTWLVKRSSDGQFVVKVWGLGTDTPVAADYDGDGQTDLAVWRGTTGEWFVLRSSDGAYRRSVWGSASSGDVPLASDHDGDGRRMRRCGAPAHANGLSNRRAPRHHKC